MILIQCCLCIIISKYNSNLYNQKKLNTQGEYLYYGYMNHLLLKVCTHKHSYYVCIKHQQILILLVY